MPSEPELLVDPSFGPKLRELRAERQVTVRSLAGELHVGRSTISGLENGNRRPSRAMVEHLDRTLDANGALLALVRDPDPVVDDGPDRIAHALRRPGTGIDAATVDALSVVLAAHRRLDDSIAAAALLPVVAPHHDLVIGLARHARGPYAVNVHRVAAESLQFTGWLHAQVGQHTRADRAYAASVRQATEAGAPGLASQTARFRGSLALQVGKHRQTVRHYLQAAQTPGANLLHRVDAMMRTAHGFALLGDRREALAQLRAASKLNDRAGDVEAEPFAYWLTADWLHFPLGLAYLALKEHERAAAELRTGLDALPADWHTVSWTAPYGEALERAEAGG